MNSKNEEIYNCWYLALSNVQSNNKISSNEFETFIRFSEKSLDSLRGAFLIDIGRNKLKISGINNYENKLEKVIFSLYAKFTVIKKEYPSSVDEYRRYKSPLNVVCDSAGCNNINFETGDLTGWNAYYGFNNSTTSSTIITHITGGVAGPVKSAANDTLTSTPGYYNFSIGPNPRPDYQINITSGNRGDAVVPSVPVVSPFGGKYSVMLGDSTLDNYGVAILSQTFKVTPNNDNFTYQYAAFIENPIGHPYYQKPFFQMFLLDQYGDTVPFCGTYKLPVQMPGMKSVYYPKSGDSVYYTNWTNVLVPLTKYIGQCVTVIFETGDCALGGHFGYAYLDASCGPLEITSSSPTLCKQTCVALTAPAGGSLYQWRGPSNGIVGSDTLQQICADSSGVYCVVITPMGGASCNDTLCYTLGQSVGPIPKPAFYADTVCAGTPVQFHNISHPDTTSGAKFYWDFYNSGSYEDSAANPQWTYLMPGTYTVRLDEVSNGCGQDTVIDIIVDTCNILTNIPVVKESEKLDIYPNPSTGLFTLKFNVGAGGEYRINIFNELGTKVYSSIPAIGVNGIFTSQINLASFGKGVYAMELYKNGLPVLVKKIVVLQ